MKVHPSVTDERIYDACNRVSDNKKKGSSSEIDPSFCLACGAQRDFEWGTLAYETPCRCKICGQYTVYSAWKLLFMDLQTIDPIGAKTVIGEREALINKFKAAVQTHFESKPADPRQVIRACFLVAWDQLKEIPDDEWQRTIEDLQDEVGALYQIFHKDT